MRKKIQFRKLFNRYDNYSDEIRFEVFRWLVNTGWNYRIDYRGSEGVFEQIWGLCTVNSQDYWYDQGFNSQDYWYDHGINNLDYTEEMQLSFMRAIISDDCLPVVKKWREKHGISIDGVRYLNLNISNNSISRQLGKLLFDAHKSKLSIQLNECWPQAINIDSVLLACHKDEWHAILRYGFDESLWSHTLATQGDYTFSVFLDNACTELGRVIG